MTVRSWRPCERNWAGGDDAIGALRIERGESKMKSPVRARVRFDFRGESRPRRFLFGSEDPAQVAEKVRERQVEVLRNLPLQGIQLEEINSESEIYRVTPGSEDEEVAYAPVELTVRADSIEDLIPFTIRQEFRCIKLLEPDEVILSPYEIERMLYRVSEQNRGKGVQLGEFR